MNALHRLRDEDHGDDGFTIVELLVTMVITGIVLAMLGTFFANISRLTDWSGKDRVATGQAALALDAVRSVVRVAADLPAAGNTTKPAIQSASPTKLVVIAYSQGTASNSAPTEVTFELVPDGSTGTSILRETRRVGQLQGQYYVFTGNGTTTPIATGFVTNGQSPFFGYSDASAKPIAASGGVAANNLGKITFIQVTTTLNPTTAGGPSGPVVVTTTVSMPNLQRDVSATVSVPNLPTPTTTPTPTPTPVRTTPASSSPTPTTGGSSGGSGTGTGTGSGSGTGTGTTKPTTGTGTGGGGTPGGGTGTSSPKPSATATTSPKPTSTPTKTATPSPTPRPTVVDL